MNREFVVETIARYFLHEHIFQCSQNQVGNIAIPLYPIHSFTLALLINKYLYWYNNVKNRVHWIVDTYWFYKIPGLFDPQFSGLPYPVSGRITIKGWISTHKQYIPVFAKERLLTTLSVLQSVIPYAAYVDAGYGSRSRSITYGTICSEKKI